jgi:hypothetical protein
MGDPQVSWNRVEANATEVSTPVAPVAGIWRTLRSYILWAHERGSVQYDVMVTLILLFVFFSPKLINFKDKPIEHNPYPTGVAVMPDGQGGLIYQVEGSAVAGQDEGARTGELLAIIEPISGEVTITKVEAERDRSGRVKHYKVWVERK